MKETLNINKDYEVHSNFVENCLELRKYDVFMLSWWLSCKESACPAGDMGSIPGKMAWWRKWQPSPVFLPGESHGQRSLVGHSSTVPQIQLSFWRRRCICKLLVMYWDWSGGKLCTQEGLEGGGAWETVFKIQWILWPMWKIFLPYRFSPTLCDPIDGSLPGSPIPGIFQARTLEWIAISFSNAWKWKVKLKSLSRLWLFMTPWTSAYQAPPPMGFSRQEYWSGLPLPSPLWKINVSK